MKTGSKLAAIIFLIVALAHFLRIVFSMPITVDDWLVPQWISALGVIVPCVVAWLLWRDSK